MVIDLIPSLRSPGTDWTKKVRICDSSVEGDNADKNSEVIVLSSGGANPAPADVLPSIFLATGSFFPMYLSERRRRKELLFV